MSHIILQPCGSAEARSHYVDTILNIVSIDRIKKFVEQEKYNKLVELYVKRNIPVWGVVPGEKNVNINKWNRINPGDVTLFARNSKIFASAVVTYKIHNKALAIDLWNFDKNRQTWEYLYFLDEIKSLNIAYSEFNSAAGYKPKNLIRGFNVLDSEKSTKVFSAFDLESDVHQPAISEKDYDEALKQLQKTDSLDSTRQVNARIEQSFLRQYLFKEKKIAKCGICNRELPIQFLIAGHIKKRSQCTLDEQKDYASIVMPMCCFGCDDLFEKGYVSVENGKIIRLNVLGSTPAVEEYLEQIVGMECICWNENNEKYFQWHRKHHTTGKL